MRFKSENHPAFQQFVRHKAEAIYDGAGRLTRPEVPGIMVSFGIHGAEYTYHDPLTGAQETGADIRGGFFDTVEQQKIEGWTDEEREQVERVLMEVAEAIPAFVQVWEEPQAKIPWTTYDTTKPQRIPVLARELGSTSVEEALVYERQNKNREAVLAALESVKAEAADDQEDVVAADSTEDEDALVAAVN